MNLPVQAAGILIFTRMQPKSFLLLKHHDRWDLPKGHAEPGESLMDTALREAHEETGIPVDDIEIDPQFRFRLQYPVVSTSRGSYLKTVTYFLGFVSSPCRIVPTEHPGYAWFCWPADEIQAQTIDPLLNAVQRYFESTTSAGRPAKS